MKSETTPLKTKKITKNLGNIKDSIRNIIVKTEEKTITGDALREALFEQGHNISEVNVKISLMRSKGDLLLESGIYRLGNHKSTTHSDALAGINSNSKMTKNAQKSRKIVFFGQKTARITPKTENSTKIHSVASY